MQKFLVRIKRIMGLEKDAYWLKKQGAIVGNDVEIYNLVCSKNDAKCLEIGDKVTIAGAHILTHDASPKRFLGNDINIIGRVVIGNNVFIGADTIILPNVTIGNNVVVGAGSVVTHNVDDNTVVAGNPAKVISSIDSFIEKHKTNIGNENNMFWNIKRGKLKGEPLRQFNQKINGRKIYLGKK